jgi:hypothetical protein
MSKWVYHVHQAAFNGDLDLLKQLITRENVNAYVNGYGITALQRACHGRQLHCIQWLVKDMNACMDANVIHTAVLHQDVLELLLQLGCQIDYGCPNTALYIFISESPGWRIHIKRLMLYGARLENMNKGTVLVPLYATAFEMALDVVRRRDAANAGRALLLVFKLKGAPNDLARDVVRRLVMPRWKQCGVIDNLKNVP